MRAAFRQDRFTRSKEPTPSSNHPPKVLLGFIVPATRLEDGS
jgi:hypothetical protein